MICSYAGFNFDDHEAAVTYFGAQRLYSPRDSLMVVRKRCVIQGEIIAAGQRAISIRLNQILEAFALDGGKFQLYTTAGETTPVTLGESGSISGCRVVDGPTVFTQEGKAHYTNGLPFQITLEADYLASNTGLIFYEETITRIGQGRPRSVVVELDNGLPVEQTVSSNTPIVVVQRGTAVGLLSYPVPNIPLLPINTMRGPEDDQISESAPRRSRFADLEYPVSWLYRFTLTSPVGIPHPLRR